ncbi:transposase [Polynucleobacter sp. JS-Safj-400b-B2]|uniref:RNA-guided endonuclease InsQ/TnpB family protein n=1 Tax=Polynucleobacter sp. JS-Safj-400b-B2 TaxID=2576921 RepID=UPI001C0ACD69|nr:RNA-guided endonuclease TnpB family protein [Polynucleobacter sp. JS-Safj-400b-B2]MBU3625263.1 transposase [Polynucleobacter sp. JS-Safj-400b-B2]
MINTVYNYSILGAIKIRLYPNKIQEQKLAQDFGNARKVWNLALDLKQKAYANGESLSCYDIKKMLPVWKNGEYDYLKQTHSQVLQESILHLDGAYKNAFARVKQCKHATSRRTKNSNVFGFPVFKSRYDSRQAISYPQGVTVSGNKITLPKIGQIKARVHREIVGKMKTVTILRESTGKYYAAILTEDFKLIAEPLQSFDAAKIIGIDLGVKDWIVDSNGNKLPNPHHLKKSLKKLHRLQKDLSRKIEFAKDRCIADGKPTIEQRNYFGSNIAKNRKHVALAHEKVRHARENYQHQVSFILANENQVVVAETLNIRGMMANRRLSKAIGDCAWGGFLIKLDYKLKAKGGQPVQISTWFPSTKTCNHCGVINEHITLNDRMWTCSSCHATVDRDINAALNIRDAGIVKIKAAGLSVYAHGGHVRLDAVGQAAAAEVGSLCDYA